MAEDNIDKALPNEPRKKFNIPGEEEIREQVVEEVQVEQESPAGEGTRICLTTFSPLSGCNIKATMTGAGVAENGGRTILTAT